jgi:hypothetical protein
MVIILDIITSCVILQNLIIEDEHNLNIEPLFEHNNATQIRCILTFEHTNMVQWH